MARASRSAPAYRHVDIGCIPPEHKDEILADADGGGRDFGLTIVEVVHNGPAQTNIYGVYAGEPEQLWQAALEEFGFEETDPSVDLTAEASAAAEAAAAKAKADEEAAIAAVAGDKGSKK